MYLLNTLVINVCLFLNNVLHKNATILYSLALEKCIIKVDLFIIPCQLLVIVVWPW